MILKASARGGASRLAQHLLKADENEHVEIHDVRGFISDDIGEAFQEAHAIARGTRCQKFLFSLSLSPPENEDVGIDVFEAAIEQIEQSLGLDDQPRAIVFHEKEGRRHAHAVWSRVNAGSLTAIEMPFFKRKLNDIARELYLEHGWPMPKGFLDARFRDPLSFTRAEWQQAKRTKQDPKALKALFQSCWAASDDAASLARALQEHGFFLAKGDRRGFVAIDYRGEVYSLSRYAGVKTKELKSRLGDPKDLRSVEQAKGWIAERMSEQLKRYVSELSAKHEKRNLASAFQRERMVSRHRQARSDLRRKQKERQEAEDRTRTARLPRGIKAIWSWMTGQTKKIRMQNALEISNSEARDRAEREEMIRKQLAERRTLQRQIVHARGKQHEAMADLNRDVAHYMLLGGKAPIEITKVDEKDREQIRDRRRSFDPDL